MKQKISIGTSKILKGIRCVVATADIQKGESIELCPVILIPKKDWKLITKTVFNFYDYDWDKNYTALALGFGSIYNHSHSANAKYQCHFETKIMEYVAVKKIKKGEEIFVNYGDSPSDKKALKKGYINFKN